MLPADSHVHSQWSWDAAVGDMEGSCARAVELGLPAIAFTEHLDHTVWTVEFDGLDPGAHLAKMADPNGLLTPPAFDVPGYLAAVARCRERFPSLVVLSGLEVGEPHRHAEAVAQVLAAGPFDRVLGSVHCLPTGDGFAEPPGLYPRQQAADVMRQYLAEIAALAGQSQVFSVLAHIDYAVRYWPAQAGPFDPCAFEDEFRHALRALADSGRALEVNTKVPLHPEVVGWWRQEGGRAVTFGSDAHHPAGLGRGFGAAVAMVEAYGFRPGRHPHDLWTRPR
ncbi:PHP domain-containing protein [Catellatospora citrea]|uniref:Histidinol-phosphatase n=1 Tax=Catellatospora citrea TaxID=53366 RepID=A0A8J3P105_9ACTN|nr:PHP domain-containing protein [Catellatospora citrea]RKE00386.1 histidinol-phosphatase (PHP family) [Catellatospora citrea]GIF99401.1 histidinol-phosphatase [Catellatospora citrea]